MSRQAIDPEIDVERLEAKRHPSRAHHPRTLEELVRNFTNLFADGQVALLSETAAKASWDDAGQPTLARSTKWDAGSKRLLIVLIDAESNAIAGGISILFERALGEIDLRVAGWMARVFNHDLRTAPRYERDQELWLTLQQTRFSRVVARSAPFHTDISFRWLRQFENAGSLTYEGESFSTSLIIVKQRAYVEDNPRLRFVKFSDALPLAQALFDEKWVRALTAKGHVHLVGLGHDNGIIGVVTGCGESERSDLIAPHHSLNSLVASLEPGMMMLTTTPSGDLYALFPTGLMFVKSQGHWRYLNLELLGAPLENYLEPAALNGTIRLIADMSYERKGALFVFCDDRRSIARMIPDHDRGDRVNRPVRNFARRLNITDVAHQTILRNVAAIDGAVVVGRDGHVLDAACMVATPTVAELAAAGFSQPKTFAGARTTAAWNASLYGISVKVSEDGPITVFRAGKLVLSIG